MRELKHEYSGVVFPGGARSYGGNQMLSPDKVMRRCGCGIVAEQECVALAEAARKAAAMTAQQREAMGKAAREYYDGHFVMDALVDQLLELMNEKTKQE